MIVASIPRCQASDPLWGNINGLYDIEKAQVVPNVSEGRYVKIVITTNFSALALVSDASC